MTYTPSRSTRFLTGLSTLLLVASIGFGVFLLAGAIVGFGPSGDEVAIHTEVATESVAELPPDSFVSRSPHESATQRRNSTAWQPPATSRPASSS